MAKHCRHPKPDLELELRIVVGGTVVVGPLQAAVLAGIRDCGSISGAQRQLGATYAHVWKLVAAMNDRFSPPVVQVARGGTQGGGARLTPHGHEVLGAFQALERLLAIQGQPELGVIRRATASAVNGTQGFRTHN
jgi:molybdate transport system regulatory protein